MAPGLPQGLVSSAAESVSPEQFRRFVVYALIDPRDGRIRYVGKTGNLKRRLAVTWCARSREDVGGSKAKRAWLLELDAAGLRPSVRVLESNDDFAAIGEAEERWIARGRAEAWGLTNCHVKTSGTVPHDVRSHTASAESAQ